MARSERRFIASADVVYSIVVDAARYPRWLVGARRVRVRDPSWPRAGSSFDHRVGAGPVEVHDATTVTKNVPGRILELNVRARPFLEAIVRFEVRPDGEGCRLTMDEVPVGIYRALAPLIAPLMKLRNDRSLAKLAAIVDGARP